MISEEQKDAAIRNFVKSMGFQYTTKSGWVAITNPSKPLTSDEKDMFHFLENIGIINILQENQFVIMCALTKSGEQYLF